MMAKAFVALAAAVSLVQCRFLSTSTDAPLDADADADADADGDIDAQIAALNNQIVDVGSKVVQAKSAAGVVDDDFVHHCTKAAKAELDNSTEVQAAPKKK